MPSDHYVCGQCGSDAAALAARNTDPTPSFPGNTQLVRCRDCDNRWAVTNGVKHGA